MTLRKYQPFPRLEAKYIPEFLRQNKRYLVSQSYPRGEVKRFGEKSKTPLVFTLYDDLGYARIHMNAVRGDQFAAIIDLQNEKHVNKITQMMEPDSRYDVYISMVWKNDENERYLRQHYCKNVERYTKSIQWHVPRTDEVEFRFKVIFGEPYMLIKWRNNNVQVKFEEIENA